MKVFFEYLLHYKKAIRKFLVALSAAIAQLGIVWTTGTPENAITGPEWLTVILAFMAAIGIYTVPNKTDTNVK